jgi:hypothetical protein
MARAMRTAAATAALLGLIISAIDEADNEQNDAGANEGIDDRAEDSATNQNTDYRQQPSRNDAVHALGRVLTPRSLFVCSRHATVARKPNHIEPRHELFDCLFVSTSRWQKPYNQRRWAPKKRSNTL